MCIFSGEVYKVENTKIFGAKLKDGKQSIIYEMEFGSENDLAMILPIPVSTGSEENVVEFKDLSEYEDFFKDLDKPFNFATRGLGAKKGSFFDHDSLQVHNVGSFEASYVPTINDFDRLDSRFTLPTDTWDKIPEYKNGFGFVVFKLKAGNNKPHPMAFIFPSSKENVFFPTVHIHDGKVHEKEHFDHALYFQKDDLNTAYLKENKALRSRENASNYINSFKVSGLMNFDNCYAKKSLIGMLENKDTYL